MIVYLDTNCVIYFVECNPTWHTKVITRIAAIRSGGDALAVSDLTQAEVFVLPFRHADAVIEASYRAFFADPDITVFPITQAVCEKAARLRAVHPSIKLPDALHLAVAIEHDCGLFLTADAGLAACTDIAVEVLS